MEQSKTPCLVRVPKESYGHAIDEFIAWYSSDHGWLSIRPSCCHSDHDRVLFGAGMVELLIKIVAEFKEASIERGILSAYDGLRQEIADIDYPLGDLKAYSAGSTEVNERSSYIFTFFIKGAAQEFDEDYAGEVPE